MKLIHRIANVRQIRLGRLWISWSRQPFTVGSHLVVWCNHRRLWPRTSLAERGAQR
jgi:hypothetical protein